MVELSGLLLIIFIGLYAVTQGNADFSRVVVFESSDDRGVFFAVTAATSLAFFAMVGFEDSVNMAEECEDPVRDFPRVMLTGLGITGTIYVLVSITAVALVPVGDLTNADLGPALNQVVAAGAPDLPFDKIFPFIGMFAVANSALINMLMASRLLYGLANQDVLPRTLGKVHRTRRTPWVAILFTTAIAFGLIIYVVRANASEDGAKTVTDLGGTTALLLLCVFTVVNIALLVLRRSTVEHEHFRTPTFLPYFGAAACFFLAGPWARTSEQMVQYKIAGLLLAPRHRAVGDHLDDQPRRPRQEDRLPRHRAPGEVGARRYQHGCRRSALARIIAPMRTRWVLAGTTALLYVVGSVVDFAAERASGWYASGLAELLLFAPVLLSSFAVGWLLVLRRAGGAIGWLLLANWLVLLTFGFASTYAGYSYSPTSHADLPGARFAAVWDTHGWPLLFAPFVPPPDAGAERNPALAPLAMGRGARPPLLHGGHGRRRARRRAAGPALPGHDVLRRGAGAGARRVRPGLLGMTVTLLLAAASLVLRYRRSDALVRRQLKWIALAGCLLPVAILSSTFLDDTGDSSGVATVLPFLLLSVALPVSIGVAVLRYRLYDVDQVVSTTVVLATLTVLLAATFAGVIVLGGVLIGGGSPVTTAAATLAVAVAFRPLRSAVQSRVERAFNPGRWSGEQRVDDFLADLRAGRVEPESVSETLAAAAGDPASVSTTGSPARSRTPTPGATSCPSSRRPSGPHPRPSRRPARSARSCTPTGPSCAASSTTSSSGRAWRSRSPACASRYVGSSPRWSTPGPAS